MKVMPTISRAKLSLESVVVATKNQISCDLSGEAAILDLNSGVYYGLNEIGAFIWKQIETAKTVNVLRDLVREQYDVDCTQCEHDLLRLLSEMANRELIEVKDGQAA